MNPNRRKHHIIVIKRIESSREMTALTRLLFRHERLNFLHGTVACNESSWFTVKIAFSDACASKHEAGVYALIIT